MHSGRNIVWSLALLFVAMTATAQAETSNSICRARSGALCSKTFVAHRWCNGQDQTAILETPWEPRPIAIVGVGLSVNFTKWSPWFWLPGTWVSAFAGNSYQPDVMLWQDGKGSSTLMFNGGTFALPARSEPDPPHVDLHVSCHWPAAYTARLIVYYRLD